MEYLDMLKTLRTQREMIPVHIETEILIGAINHVRYAACARNEQILRYALINDEKAKEIFTLTNLSSVHKITSEQAPSAYIIIGSNVDRKNDTIYGIDIGIAAQIIREYLHQNDYSSLCIYSFNRIKTKLVVGDIDFYPELLIAVGKSNQKTHVEDSVDKVGTYRNEDNEHTVRKLTIDKLIINK